MVRIYSYMCKCCWHEWKSKNKYWRCPKCKSQDLHEDSELKEN